MAMVTWVMPMLAWIISPVATRYITDGLKLLGFDESEKMRDLENRLLPQLALMLKSAEEIPASQKRHIELWAKRLRAAFYDAEDIMDVADYHRLQKQDKIRDDIIELLYKPSSDSEPSSSNSKCYTMIGIYGIPGSGKTTLAQYIRIDERIDNHFSPIMWIHISKSFNVHNIYQEMLEAALGISSMGTSYEFYNLNKLQEELEKQLSGKRFFLVLDDFWAGIDVRVLDQLFSPLKVGNKGSMVLITTRFKEVALSFCSLSVKIPDLSENDFFNLFMHYALDGTEFDTKDSEAFIRSGKQIVEKLKASPLAARIVGARLRSKLKPIFWTEIEDQDVLHDIMGALWWSYQQLDEQVRRCFAYCSMFPRRYGFTRDALVELWVAEGFIKTSNLPEQIGRKCFDELVSYSFLQPDKYDSSSFKLHDLIHELAVKVAGSDCFRIEGGENIEIPPDVRHLFIRSKDPVKVMEQICKLQNLRTLIFITKIGGVGIKIEELKGILRNLKKLRVLQVDIAGYMKTIPSCICNLKHLRFVRIYNGLSLNVHLPKNFSTLYHLQILEFCGPGVLEFSNVKCMGHLISLRSIKYSGFSFINSNVSGFPGLQNLKSLRELSDFRVRKEKGYELRQLKGINQLSGNLRISGLECVENKEIALEAKLTDKKNLTGLSLEWSWPSTGQNTSPPNQQEDILEGLCPPSEITELKLCCYGGCKFPSWLSQNHNGQIDSRNTNVQLGKLQYLELFHCYNLEALPEIADLFTHLGILKLASLPKLQKVPKLPKGLKSLDIQRCEALDVTCREDMDTIRSHFVRQASLCDPSLNITANVEEIDKFAHEQHDRYRTIFSNVFGRRGSLPSNLIRSSVEEKDNSLFVRPASVYRIVITYCPITNTTLHNSLRGSTCLVSLNLRGLSFFTAIPYEVIQSLSKLTDISIEECVNFTLLQGLNSLSNLQHLSILKCPNLATLEEKVRVINGIVVDKISLLPQLLSTEAYSSLWSLKIHESEELREEGILEELLSLESLEISCCSWTRLPENLARLTSLKYLQLDYYRSIRSLPTLPASLLSFELTDCDPAFMKSCRKAGDPNWHKIDHVPVKKIFSLEMV